MNTAQNKANPQEIQSKSATQNQKSAGEGSGSVPAQTQVEPSSGQVTVPSGGILFIPFSFVMVAWALVFLSRLEFWKTFGNRAKTTKPCCKSPCLDCRFFQNNPYLKCAVHPSKVLSTEAKDCPDYWSRKQDKFSR